MTTEMPRLMTVAAAAELDCHPETIRRAIRAGKLTHYRLMGLIRISPDQIAAFVESGLQPARDPEDKRSTGTEEALRQFRLDRRIRKALNHE